MKRKLLIVLNVSLLILMICMMKYDKQIMRYYDRWHIMQNHSIRQVFFPAGS